LPSQPKYYTNDWSWIMRGEGSDGGLGDQIIFDLDDNKKIIMQRAIFQEFKEKFKARLANGQVATLPKSKTVWPC
ncbi:MAG: hypothetical protein ACPG39_03880, partial [Flavobacteriaceae bacterium]